MEVRAAPGRQLAQFAGRREPDATGQGQLPAWCESNAAPDGTLGRLSGFIGRLASRGLASAAQCPPDLVELAPGLLHRLDLQELREVRRAVVAAAAQPEWSGQQAFLDVVPHRASRNAAQIGEVANAVKDRVAHGSKYRQLLSHCQLSLFWRRQPGGVRR